MYKKFCIWMKQCSDLDSRLDRGAFESAAPKQTNRVQIQTSFWR